MEIAVVAPRRPGETAGNSVTAQRWSRRLVELGHDASVVWHDEGGPPPSLGSPAAVLAIHARRSAGSVTAASALGLPVGVLLAGTDLYVDLPEDDTVRRCLDRSDVIAVLQPAAVERLASLDAAWADKAMVVLQSVDRPAGVAAAPDDDRWSVAVLAHLRDVKDPLLAARAAAALPASSAVVVDHAGAAHDDEWRRRAGLEAAENPRYRWHGELSRTDALALVARSRVLACTSRHEGGANAVSEALALGVPVVATRIDGNTGLLGDDHPALVPVGDHRALAGVLLELERDLHRWEELRARSTARAWMSDPATERAQLDALVHRLR